MDWDDGAARRLSTRVLRILLAIAQSGSMAKAAKMVGTSQPAVSKTIAELEES
jgi:DNA-binding transcriptional LysR family regulator